MTALNYTTGNPNNLVGGGNASMNDIQGPFVDIRTYLNGGNLDETNVPNLSAAFTTYKPMPVIAKAQITSAGAAGRYAMFTGSPTAANLVYNAASSGLQNLIFYIDPVEYNANSRVTKLNLRLTAAPNSVSAAVTFTAGMYAVIAPTTGASGQPPSINTTAAVLSGSTAVVANPAALGLTTAVSGDFNFPAAGWYVINVVTNATPAAGSIIDLIAQLNMRQV